MYDALLDWSGTGDTPSDSGPGIGATPPASIGGSGTVQGTGATTGATGDEKGKGVNKASIAQGHKVTSSTALSSSLQHKHYSQKQEGGGDGLLVEENPIFFNI